MEKYTLRQTCKTVNEKIGNIIPVVQAELPTEYGDFTIHAYFDEEMEAEHIALIRGEPDGREGCPVRVHSQCFTGDVLGSLRCDCREQLIASLKFLSKQPYGLLIYLYQEGRGIGLLNKLRAYHLQDRGFDTVEANRSLGFPDDLRDYAAAAAIIDLLGIKSISLLTNNPQKIVGLEKYGVVVKDRIPLKTKPNKHNKFYLTTKKKKMGHLF